jgi:XTP/dITP diphosphohydrolase
MRTWVLATANAGKAQEFQELFGEAVRLVSLTDAGLDPALLAGVETGRSYAENACLKALAVQRASGCTALADDSGLEVRGLAWGPGLYTARFAGEGASDEDNIRKLLSLLGRLTEEARAAAFRATLCLAHADGAVTLASGSLYGSIAQAPRGRHGFGYDPVFVPEGEQRTLAELGDTWKALGSHRARAARALLAALAANGKGSI